MTGNDEIPPTLKTPHQATEPSARPRLVLVIDVGDLLSVGIAHDVVVGLQFGRPRRRETATATVLSERF